MASTGFAEDIRRLVTQIETDLPRSSWPPVPREWRGEAECALIDAVFSARARYGTSPSAGVRGIVQRWRNYRGTDRPLDDLRVIAAFVDRPQELGDILVMSAAKQLGADPIQLDHAIWQFQRSR